MLIGPLILLQVIAAASALAAGPLCLQGCCDQALNLPSRELSLSSGTIVSLPEAQIPCCECPSDANAPEVDNNQTPIDNSPHLADTRLPPYSIIPCPESCPCCNFCEALPQCQRKQAATYNTVRNIIGCESLPDDTPVCPVGKCTSACLCRETLVKQLKNVLVKKANPHEDITESIPEDDLKPPPTQHIQRLVPKLPPWYSVKPICTMDCPCCDYCQPIRDDCKGYWASWLEQPYPAARRAVGCDVLPATTPLCPPGECSKNCVCRETLFKRLDGIFFDESRGFDAESGSRRVEHEEL